MKKIFTVFVVILFMSSYAIAQDCGGFEMMKEGTFIEMKSYDGKQKLTGTNRQQIKEVSETNEGIVVKIESEQLDHKGKSSGIANLEMRCKDGVFYMDMKNFFNQESMGDMKDMEVSVDATDLAYPYSMQVGQELPDGIITMAFVSGPMPMNMSVKIYNRKVEAKETITTPAGSFECYKVTYDIDTKSIIKMTNSAVQWFSTKVGAVRSETYSKGKLVGYTEITAFNQ
jgi:hypothetical protein